MTRRDGLPTERSGHRSAPAGRRRRYALAAVALAVVVAGAGAWLRFGASRAVRARSGVDLGAAVARLAPGELNVVVITLDTTRADRLGAYGNRDIQTPFLDRLAREGVLFEQANSAAPLTLPAHASLFTGRFPPEHGVRDNGGFYLDPRETTLATVLKRRGYQTGAFIGAYVLDSKWGINQGFDTYFDNFDLSKYRAISLGAIQRPGNEVVDEGLRWLDRTAPAGRFFAWFHLYDAHAPYEPPEPYRSTYAGRPYLGEIAFVDAQVGRVTAYLESHGLLDRTVVVVMGDHGESLNEHGEATHGFFIYESTLHVPLIVRAPFSRLLGGRRVADVVRSIDVMPTVLDLLGVGLPDGVEGRSVLPLMTGTTADLGLETYAEARYPLHHFGWSDLRSMRSGRYKLIAAPRPELYDLQDDPREEHDIFAARAALGQRMLDRLRERERRFTAREGAQKPVEVDPDARARLAALGYVGTFVATGAPDESRTGLADPKDKVDLFNKITRARDISKDEGAFDEVVTMLKEVVHADPKVIDGWFMLGNMYAKAGRRQEAIGYFRQSLALKPDDEMAVVNLANVYRELGRDDEALVGYRRFLQLDPRNSQVRYQVAEILVDRGRLDEAERELREALAIEPKLAAARNALGVVALRRGDREGAVREIRAALAEKPDVRLAHFNLALLAEDDARWGDAIAEYRREIELHPNAYKAMFNLGRVYGRVGDRAAQADAYRQAIAANPQFAEGHLYLAKLLLDTGRSLDEAARLARRGIELAPAGEYAPLGYYVVADVLSRQGHPAQAEAEAAKGRALERRVGKPVG